MASYGKAVTGTAVMARSANEKKKNILHPGSPGIVSVLPVTQEGHFTFTSHLGAGDGFVFGVGCWFLLLVGVFLLWCFVSCCVSFLASAPYAPSYISYDVSSHSEWALDFLLGWCCFFDSLLAKDCQYPRDPMQPAI